MKTPKGKMATRIQLPLSVAECVTIHKAQGQSVDNVMIRMNTASHRGLFYVAASRARSVEGLHFVRTIAKDHLDVDDFNTKKEWPFRVIHEEYDRLRRLEPNTERIAEGVKGVDFILKLTNMDGGTVQLKDIDEDMFQAFMNQI
jgi:hypothetical protein